MQYSRRRHAHCLVFESVAICCSPQTFLTDFLTDNSSSKFCNNAVLQTILIGNNICNFELTDAEFLKDPIQPYQHVCYSFQNLKYSSLESFSMDI